MLMEDNTTPTLAVEVHCEAGVVSHSLKREPVSDKWARAQNRVSVTQSCVLGRKEQWSLGRLNGNNFKP